MRTRMLCSSLFCFIVIFCVSAHADANQYAVTYERNVAVKMRDGVILRADIYRPTADGKFPVLLQRTPYNKDNGIEFGLRIHDPPAENDAVVGSVRCALCREHARVQ